MRSFKLIVFTGLILLTSFLSKAHEIRPAYLQIKQLETNSYQVIWKVPTMGDMVLKIYPQFDSGLELTESIPGKAMSGSAVYSYKLSGEIALAGSTLEIENLKKTMVDVLVSIDYLNGEKVTMMLQPDQPSAQIPGVTSQWLVTKTYTILGIEHILFGIDHLLFVLALIIITKGFKKILKTVTAFTLAHSITLSMAVLGVANLPGPPVEAVIALSIVFLAAEIIKNINGQETLTSQKPWLVAFSFGLLHGFGFAGALSEVGLPQTEIPLALAFFNIGVELGQIAFVAVVLIIIRLLAIQRDWPLILKKAPAYAIGAISSFWVIERVLSFWN